LSTVVLIPNSVGPGELLVAVGTEEQRQRYLPRLARGDEIPCFALTEPGAGSDAASLTARGELYRGDDGELRIRLDWEKRYITLAPVATLVGLAFRLRDPGNLLGRGEEVGITCALVPADLPGVEIGRRHDPLGVPFPNGPIRGRGVVIPASAIIGGVDHAGRGWQMLMEALSGGRAVSLPAGAAAGARHVARVTGAYAAVRRQFGVEIGRFEGVEEPLARIGGLAYLMEAARVFTCGAVDAGHRPSVISALVKYNLTELMRQLACDGMDVLGGAAICQGPRNLMAQAYTAAPIGITVEGANILTRTLIVFGQGALRCHPHAHALLEAARRGDRRQLRRRLFAWGRHLAGNAFRSLVLGVTRGRLARSPAGGATARYYRRLAWASARFAFWADLAMLGLGAKLKYRGKLTGRFADVLSWLYLGFAALRRFEAEGRRPEDLPLVRWAAEHALERIQEGFEGIFRNFDAPLLGLLARGPALLWARLNPLGAPPSDALGAEVAALLRQPGESRDRLVGDLHRSPAMKVLEEAFELAADAAPLLARLRRAIRRGRLPKAPAEELLEAAVAAGVLDAAEAERIERAAAARREATRVDEMTLEEMRAGGAPFEPGRTESEHRAAEPPVAAPQGA
jgi:acyl-CoA dehydrogenase